uniref:Uncharacterized protein n=1 Tax=Acrobeloides nanus TaxID=290746 RepID=A0A914D7B9_9BILA
MAFSDSCKGDEVRDAEKRMHERMRMYGGTKSSSSARRRQYSRFVEYIFKNKKEKEFLLMNLQRNFIFASSAYWKSFSLSCSQFCA